MYLFGLPQKFPVVAEPLTSRSPVIFRSAFEFPARLAPPLTSTCAFAPAGKVNAASPVRVVAVSSARTFESASVTA